MPGEEEESAPNVRYDLSHFRPDTRATLNEIMDAQERMTGTRTRNGRFGVNSVIRVLRRTSPHGRSESQSESRTSDTQSVSNTSNDQPGRSTEDHQTPNRNEIQNSKKEQNITKQTEI